MTEPIMLSYCESLARIENKGAYLQSLTLDGKEIIKKSNDGIDTHGGMALLLPYANRVRNALYMWDDKEYFLPKNSGAHSIHGLTRGMEWAVMEKTERETRLALELNEESYPGALSLQVSYRLSSQRLDIDIMAINNCEKELPFVAGMHPYFLHGGEWALQSDRTLLRLNYEDGFFPDGTVTPVNPHSICSYSLLEYDSCFISGDSTTLNTPDHSIHIETRNMPYIVVYSGKYSEGKSVAVEPMSGAPDAFNNRIGLVTIRPGAQFVCGSSFSLSARNGK